MPLGSGPNPQDSAFWSGRLALTVATEPAQSFFAGFELEGDARTGALRLFSPLGNLLADLRWSPAGATLTTPGQPPRTAASVEALSRELTGTALPLRTLFAWLRGDAEPAEGWQADLSQLADGRLRAQRLDPAPAADLRLILER